MSQYSWYCFWDYCLFSTPVLLEISNFQATFQNLSFQFGFDFQCESTYGELFVYALRTLGILSVGLYRLRDVPGGATATDSTTKRYVITNPPDDFPLLSSDKVSRSSLNIVYTLSIIWSRMDLNYKLQCSGVVRHFRWWGKFFF